MSAAQSSSSKGASLAGTDTNLQATPTEPCANLGCPQAGTLVCARCHSARYCGRVCQKAHWETMHKLQCKALAAAKPSLPTAPAASSSSTAAPRPSAASIVSGAGQDESEQETAIGGQPAPSSPSTEKPDENYFLVRAYLEESFADRDSPVPILIFSRSRMLLMMDVDHPQYAAIRSRVDPTGRGGQAYFWAKQERSRRVLTIAVEHPAPQEPNW